MRLCAWLVMVPVLLTGCGDNASDTTPSDAGAGGAAGVGGSGGSTSVGGQGGENAGGTSAGGTSAGGASAGGGGAGGDSGGGGTGGAIATPEVPDAIKVPTTDHVKLEAHGVGVQIYTCTDMTAAGGAGGAGGSGGAGGAGGAAPFQWVFKEPKADLFDMSQTKIGIHYVGPTWESTDGSKVVGASVAKVASPTPGNIPWLLLQAKSSSGTGVLTDVTYIQRIDTQAGVAPDSGCDSASVGTESQIAYEANYYFYAP